MSGGGGKNGGGGGSYTTGYRYFFGIHMGIGRGPVDELCEVKVGDRTAWSGAATSNGAINIDQYNLFGGEEKEGGIQGTLAVMMGEPTQTAPDSLRSLFGASVPNAVTISGTVGGNGLYAKSANYQSYYTTIGGVLWQLALDGFGHWTIFSSTGTIYRSADAPSAPEAATGWSRVTLAPDGGAYNFETGQYDTVESLTPVAGLTITANYSLVPGFRRMFTVFFDGLVAMNNPYPKPWKFRVRRVLKGWDGDVWQPSLAKIMMGDVMAMNGAHIIYECLTNREWGRGLPRTSLDDTAFTQVAQTLYNEGFGLCLRWSRTDDIKTFIKTVLNHIGGALFTSRSTGLQTLRLIRGDYDLNTLPHFTPETGLLEVTDNPVASTGVSTNEVVVTYREPTSDEDRTVRVSNLAALQANGGAINSVTREYKGVPNAEFATKLAQRDLRVSSIALRKFTVRLDRRGRSIEPGGVFLISDPSRSIPVTPVRAGQIEDGTLTGGAITVTAAQDVFSLPTVNWNVEVPNTWTPPTTLACLDVHKVFEIPYFLLAQNLRRADLAYVQDNDGFFGAVCAQGNSLNGGYQIAVRSGPSTPEDQPTTTDYFCGYTP